MEKYIIDSGDIYQGHHVSDEEVREIHNSFEDAKKEFSDVVKLLKDRDNSYVYIMKYVDDECVGVVMNFYS